MQFNKLIPELKVFNFEKSLDFYTKMLGFKVEYKRPETKFAFLSFQGSQIMIEKINNNWKTAKLKHPYGRGINFQIKVKNINFAILIEISRIGQRYEQGKFRDWFKRHFLSTLEDIDTYFRGSCQTMLQQSPSRRIRFDDALGFELGTIDDINYLKVLIS